MAVVPHTRRFTIKEYYRMAAAGILSENDRVELIEGEVIEMTPIGARHAGTVNRLAEMLWRQVRDRAIVQIQNPVRLTALNSEPQPDVAILRRRLDFYASSHPEPDHTLLIVEVMDTSHDYDRRVKTPLYARAGIPEVWLVDLVTDTVEVLRRPSAEGYKEARTLGRNERLTIEAFPDVAFSLAELLG